MKKFTTHTGRAVPLRRSNVDTDQIIPARYLKRVSRTGFEDGLFSAWRDDPEFVLNREEYQGASVLIAGPDFGTGSSREHAVWALQNYGFRVVISPRFADIFRGNSLKAGLLTLQLPQSTVDELMVIAEESPEVTITVNLEKKLVTMGNIETPFEIDGYSQWRLMEGLDDIGLTLAHVDVINSYEAARPTWLPRTVEKA